MMQPRLPILVPVLFVGALLHGPAAATVQTAIRFSAEEIALAQTPAGSPARGTRVAAVLDANMDELPDLFLGRGAGERDRLLLQLPDGGWQLRELPVHPDRTRAVLALDLNRDLAPDLVLLRDSGITLLLNDGRGEFVDATPQEFSSGARDGAITVSISAADVNRDGWVDLYESRTAEASASRVGNDAGCRGLNRLWLNAGARDEQGRPQFREATDDSNAAGCGATTAAVWVDLDHDGDMDLVLAHPEGRPEMLENDGQGHFQKRTIDLDLGRGWSGVAAGDYDNDGDLDLLFHVSVASAGTAHSVVLLARNEGEFRFVDVTRAVGFGGARPVAAAIWFDADNDGLLDLLTTGTRGGPMLFRQQAPGVFRDVSATVGFGGAAAVSTLAADVNRDGYVDIVSIPVREPVRVLINQKEANHWLGVRLRARDNATTLGARVVVTLRDGTRLTRQQYAGDGVFVPYADELLFGFGRRTQVDAVRVYWPSGSYTQVEQAMLDRHVGFVEPTAASGGRHVVLRNPVLETLKRNPPRMCR